MQYAFDMGWTDLNMFNPDLSLGALRTNGLAGFNPDLEKLNL